MTDSLIMSEQVDQLAAAMVKAQGALPVIPKTKQAKIATKNGGEYRYSYADLEDVVTATRPILRDNGLCVKQYPTAAGLITLVMHESGQYVGAEMVLAPQDTPQGQGSALTYARRYAYCAALGIVADEDDDATAAQHATAGSDDTPRPWPTERVKPEGKAAEWAEFKMIHSDVDWQALYAMQGNSFVSDVLSKGPQYGSLTEKQLAGLRRALAPR